MGAKYPRDELIASVLFPSAKISSGYEPSTAGAGGRPRSHRNRPQRDGRLGRDPGRRCQNDPDGQGRVDERKRSDVSLMPNGLAQGLSPQDFADLIAYLETLRNPK